MPYGVICFLNLYTCGACPVSAGRWKATTVAVKIIEHYGVDAEASTGSRRVSAGREMLFATSISHPNGERNTCFDEAHSIRLQVMVSD
jgi:hypothetical protein